MTQPIDPTLFGTPPQSNALPFNDFVKTYDDGINAAQKQYDMALQRLKEAKDAKDAIDQQVAADPNKAILLGDQQKSTDAEYQRAATTAEQSQALVTRAHDAKGAAIERYNQRGNISPALAERYKADADLASANAQAQNTKNFEALAAIPETRAQLHASTQEAEANAVVAQAKADVANATTDIEKQAAQTRLDQATASLASTQLANTQAGLQNKLTAAKAAVAPRVEAATATTAEAGATTAQANAANAVATSAANLQKTQADANSAELAYKNAQANFDALTPEMRTQAAQADLDAKKTAVQTTQEALKLAQDTHDTNVEQQKATLAQTQQNVQKGALGTLYGLQQKADEIQGMIRSGQFGTGQQAIDKANAQLQDYLNTTIQGTTPFERASTALGAETQRRQQDYSLAGTQMSTLGSVGSSLFSSLASQNKDAPASSTSMATAYGGVMGALMNAMQAMRPNIPANSDLLNSMRPTVPATPTTTIAPDGTVTVQHAGIGSGAASNPQPPAFLAPPVTTAPPPVVPPPDPGLNWLMNSPASPITTPAMLMGNQPATPAFHASLWDNDPNLHPAGVM